jgi:hypothetical protein
MSTSDGGDKIVRGKFRLVEPSPADASLEPCSPVVAQLESMLEKAKTGKLQAFAYTFVEVDEHGGSAVAGWRGARDLYEWRLAGGIMMLHYRFSKEQLCGDLEGGPEIPTGNTPGPA